MGHIRDRWTVRGESGRRVKGPRWGKGKRWQARWTTPDGREHVKAFSAKDAAEEHLSRVDVASRDGEWIIDETTTLAQWADRWRARQVHHRDGTAATRDRHLDHLLLADLGDRRVATLTRGEIADHVAAWTVAPTTQRVAWAFIGALLREARTERLTRVDLTTGVRLPPLGEDRVDPLSVEQVAAIAREMTPSLRAAVWFAAGTGLRPGEWRGLTLDRVRMIGGVPHVIVDRQLVGADAGAPVWGRPKTAASDRRVSLAASTHRVLLQHLERHPPGEYGLIFARARTGRPLSSRSDIAEPWGRAAARAGVMVPDRSGWHALRHHHVSLLIAAGLSPRVVAERLGHKDVAETMRTYAHLWHDDDERSRQAVEDALGDASRDAVTVT